MHSARTGRILAVVVAVALASALGVMWLRSGGDEVEVATAAEAEAGEEVEGDASEDGDGADRDDSADSDEPTPAPAGDNDPGDSPDDDAAEESDTEAGADEDASVDVTESSVDDADDETEDEPTAEPTDEATDAPDEEPSEEPSEDPAEPDEIDEDFRAELDELRTVGGPAEALVRAEDQDDIDNWLHAGWGMARFDQPQEDQTSEWVNPNELWNEIVDTTWGMAIDEYGERIRDRPGTIWDKDGVDGLPAPAFGVFPSSWIDWHDYGFLMWVWVGVDPEDPDQARPDAALYTAQVLGQEEDPGRWRGELHRVASLCVVDGETPWDDKWGGQVWDAVGSCPSPEPGWETVDEIQRER